MRSARVCARLQVTRLEAMAALVTGLEEEDKPRSSAGGARALVRRSSVVAAGPAAPNPALAGLQHVRMGA